jgi:hypothetical protein
MTWGDTASACESVRASWLRNACVRACRVKAKPNVQSECLSMGARVDGR